MNPYKFLRKTIYGWKMLFEKFKEGCLVHDHLLNLSRMKEAILSLVLPGASNKVSAHEDIWFGGRCYLKSFKMTFQWMAISDI